MSKIITEETPSSGVVAHTHKWQKVEGGGDTEHDMLVCEHADCSESKLVKKPKIVETKAGKSLLLG